MMRWGTGALAAGLVLAACGETTGPNLQLDPTVRVLHAAPESPRLEVVLNEQSRALLEYAEVSDWLTVEAGDSRVQLLIAG
ncbi:MAG TPA: DUF4397 domain-containing protein, partial [Longimicrobiales bacterium]|nr:DUF4397 domain-containing protein [Longimicrobiales bacterium]